MYKAYVDICKGLGDNIRIEIFDMLKCGEMCACRILEAFSITQPTLSYHMKMLTECNLVDVRREGKWNYYSINCATLDILTAFLNKNK